MQGSLRARLGADLGPFRVYGTGGLAVADIRHSYYDSYYPVDNRLSRASAGYTVGGGFSVAVSPAVSAGLEYRYSDYGTLVTDVNTDWDTIDRNRFKTQSVMMKLSLRL